MVQIGFAIPGLFVNDYATSLPRAESFIDSVHSVCELTVI